MTSLIAKRLELVHSWSVEDVSVIRQNGKYLPGDELKAFSGQIIYRVSRRGKFIVFSTYSGLLVAHNAMSGYWDWQDRPWTFDYVEGKRQASDSDVRVTMRLRSTRAEVPAELTLRFHDSRLFGSLRYHPGSTRLCDVRSLATLGPEAFVTSHLAGVEQIRPGELFRALQVSRRTLKDVLLDQTVIAGVGNIYAAEACYRAGIDPTRAARTVSFEETTRLLVMLDILMLEAIEFGLDYSQYLQVYRKERCTLDHPVTVTKVSGRSTYHCTTCQV